MHCLWKLRCHYNPGHNIFSSLSNQDRCKTTVLATFPNLCLWRRSLCSNLEGIDPEKLYRATVLSIYKKFHENDNKTFCFNDLFLLRRYVEGVLFSILLTLKNYVWVFLEQLVSDALRKRKMLSRILEHYPTQWLKVTISGHPLKIQVTLIPLGNCHIQFWKKIRKNKNKKTELGETEATCNSHTETTAATAVSQDAASSSIQGLVNCSSLERCTSLSRIGKKLNRGKASEVSRATGDLLQQNICRDELKTASALSVIGSSGKSCSPGLVTLTLRYRCAS